MESAVTEAIARLERRAAQEHQEILGLTADQLESKRDDFVLPVGPDVGRLMHALICSARAQLVVELGTCRGYSTLWLADAARRTGGRVVTFENDERKQREARENLAAAGLASVVEFRLGDAVELIGLLKPQVDFVLIDLWKELYVPCFDAIFPKLARGALIIADNMLFPPPARADAEAYRRHIRARPGLESVLLPIGSGIEVSRKT